MATFKKLEDIVAWQKARFFCQELKKVFPLFIEKKEYELLNQLKSSAGSAMDNIAEGFGRKGNIEFKNFLTISHGSIQESISQLYRSWDWDVISQTQFEYYKGIADETERLIFSLINHLLQTEFKGVKFKQI
jgi:four helix bundle protein